VGGKKNSLSLSVVFGNVNPGIDTTPLDEKTATVCKVEVTPKFTIEASVHSAHECTIRRGWPGDCYPCGAVKMCGGRGRIHGMFAFVNLDIQQPL